MQIHDSSISNFNNACGFMGYMECSIYGLTQTSFIMD
jgi:hypothetical protein